MVDWSRVQKPCHRVFDEKLPEQPPVLYTPLGDVQREIGGIFDGAHVDVEIVGGLAVESTSPVLSVRLASLGFEPKRDDVAVIRGTAYKVVGGTEGDGQGEADLRLEKLD